MRRQAKFWPFRTRDQQILLHFHTFFSALTMPPKKRPAACQPEGAGEHKRTPSGPFFFCLPSPTRVQARPPHQVAESLPHVAPVPRLPRDVGGGRAPLQQGGQTARRPQEEHDRGHPRVLPHGRHQHQHPSDPRDPNTNLDSLSFPELPFIAALLAAL